MVWLTKNEKKVLKFLLENSKLSDTSIGNKLNISSQATGRIRKILEEEIIKKYSIEPYIEKIGVLIFVVCQAKLKENLEENEREKFEKELISNKNIIEIIKNIGSYDYYIQSGFRNIEEVNNFWNSRENPLLNYIICTDLKIISHKNILKRDMAGLYEKSIDELGTKKDDTFS